MNTKQHYNFYQNAKEEALLQLQSVTNRVEALQIQNAELSETLASLRRDKQALETELRVSYVFCKIEILFVIVKLGWTVLLHYMY